MFESFLGVNPWTALFTLLNTLVIFLVGRKYLFGPVMKMIQDRQQEVDQMYLQAETARENALALEADYQQKLADAAQTGDELVRQATQRANARQEEILRAAQKQANAIVEKANADIQQEKKKAVNDAKDEISLIALSIAGKVVQREVRQQDHQELIDGFIDQLG